MVDHVYAQKADVCPRRVLVARSDQGVTDANPHAAGFIEDGSIGNSISDPAYPTYLGADGKAHRREVEIGLAGTDEVEVLSGVEASEKVIVKGQSGLPDGASVAVEKG
jgi:hypothetical protein